MAAVMTGVRGGPGHRTAFPDHGTASPDQGTTRLAGATAMARAAGPVHACLRARATGAIAAAGLARRAQTMSGGWTGIPRAEVRTGPPSARP